VRHVIDDDGELGGPLPVSIAHVEVAALLCGRLPHWTESPIIEGLDTVAHAHTTREGFGFGMPRFATGARIAGLLPRRMWYMSRDIASRTRAHVRELASTQDGERGGVAILVVRLPLRMRVWMSAFRHAKAVGTADVGHEAKPVEVVE
jgi:hypothetical protein